MTKPINLLNERTVRGTFFGNYKPRTDLPSVVDMYMSKVTSIFPTIPNFYIFWYYFGSITEVRVSSCMFFPTEAGGRQVYNPPSSILRHQ